MTARTSARGVAKPTRSRAKKRNPAPFSSTNSPEAHAAFERYMLGKEPKVRVDATLYPHYRASRAKDGLPALVRYVWFDAKGRRCTAFPVTCDANGLNNDANAAFIARALAERDGCAVIAP